MLREFTIQLRVNFDDKEKEEVLVDAVRRAAKSLFTAANLVADGRQPQIVIASGDMFEGEREIALADADDND